MPTTVCGCRKWNSQMILWCAGPTLTDWWNILLARALYVCDERLWALVYVRLEYTEICIRRMNTKTHEHTCVCVCVCGYPVIEAVNDLVLIFYHCLFSSRFFPHTVAKWNAGIWCNQNKKRNDRGIKQTRNVKSSCNRCARVSCGTKNFHF